MPKTVSLQIVGQFLCGLPREHSWKEMGELEPVYEQEASCSDKLSHMKSPDKHPALPQQAGF